MTDTEALADLLAERDRLRDALDEADSDAHRLALELECLLLDRDIPMSATSRWWESSHEALMLHRQRLNALHALADNAREMGLSYDDPNAVLSNDGFWRFIVSVVMLRPTDSGFNTQNKLYDVQARSQEEAHGKAIPLAQSDFPGHSLHTICAYRLDVVRQNAGITGGTPSGS